MYSPEPRLDPPEYEVPECPICHQECWVVYRNLNGVIVGCDNCISREEV